MIDGLTPSMLEDTLERGTAPALALLAEHGRYRRAISTFPSLTPVCLSALATGAHPDVQSALGVRMPDRVPVHQDPLRERPA